MLQILPDANIFPCAHIYLLCLQSQHELTAVSVQSTASEASLQICYQSITNLLSPCHTSVNFFPRNKGNGAGSHRKSLHVKEQGQFSFPASYPPGTASQSSVFLCETQPREHNHNPR